MEEEEDDEEKIVDDADERELDDDDDEVPKRVSVRLPRSPVLTTSPLLAPPPTMAADEPLLPSRGVSAMSKTKTCLFLLLADDDDDENNSESLENQFIIEKTWAAFW